MMKKTIGILSIVLSLIVEFQSLIAGLGNALRNSGEVSGSVGFITGILMFVGGVIVLCSGLNKPMVVTSIVFYVLAGTGGFLGAGSFADLNIWSGVNILFALLLIFHLSKKKNLYTNQHTA